MEHILTRTFTSLACVTFLLVAGCDSAEPTNGEAVNSNATVNNGESEAVNAGVKGSPSSAITGSYDSYEETVFNMDISGELLIAYATGADENSGMDGASGDFLINLNASTNREGGVCGIGEGPENCYVGAMIKINGQRVGHLDKNGTCRPNIMNESSSTTEPARIFYESGFPLDENCDQEIDLEVGDHVTAMVIHMVDYNFYATRNLSVTI